MDFGTLIFLGFLWFLFNLLRRGGTTTTTSAPPPSYPSSADADATQREGSRLEILLRDLNRSLEEAQLARVPEEVEGNEAEEAAGTLEEAPATVSLETELRRPERARVDQDDRAAQVAARRIAAAATRDRPRTVEDHRAFDRRIRQEPADHTAVRRPTPQQLGDAAVHRYTPQQLRDAMVWREILGPPAALREHEPTSGLGSA